MSAGDDLRFGNEWFDKMLTRQVSEFPAGVSPDAEAIGRSIMMAGAFIADAIDLAFYRQEDGTPSAGLADMAYEMAKITVLLEKAIYSPLLQGVIKKE